MGFTTTVHLVHDELPLVPTIEVHPDLILRYEYGETLEDRRLLFVSAFCEERSDLERSLEADPTISNPTPIATFDNRTIYRLETETDLEIIPGRCGTDGLFVFTVTSGDGGWIVRGYLPDRDALSAFRARCRERGISFRVTQLCDSSSADEQTYYLTEQQRELLMMAYYAGYFEVPRTITQDDLAERLEISDSAVSQRIRRAVSELIAGTLENNREVDIRG
ncbi:helix-turn-helix domain-containing protein [Natronosalvus amylolyticus]|uniref:helix-turn-helix domain-containing protein n=1 Tax=Natronosalvus amylolyticus TaxID=2961994 RepID=UPI0020C9E2BE|nr:helix-turn-helix domain-containing protein [Natronosalvus amylolyticus]